MFLRRSLSLIGELRAYVGSIWSFIDDNGSWRAGDGGGRRKRLSYSPGTTLGSYLIVEQIGRGGMATVYKAYEEPLTRHVAIKVLPEFFAEDKDYRVRFQVEAVAVAKLRHNNILTDFGLAKVLGGDTITVTGQVLGTPEYMAPELVQGDGAGPAADRYSLGVVAYQMLTGRVPFQGNTPGATLMAQVQDPLP